MPRGRLSSTESCSGAASLTVDVPTLRGIACVLGSLVRRCRYRTCVDHRGSSASAEPTNRDTVNEERKSILTWLNSSEEVLHRIYAQLEHLASIRLPTPMAAWTPSLQDLRGLIEVA